MINKVDAKINSNRKVLKGIGIFEIAGGVLGLLAVLLVVMRSDLDGKLILLLLLPIAFYAFSIFAGMRLLTKVENGVRCSIILQYIQVPAFSFGAYTYLLVSGGYFVISYGLSDHLLNFQFSLIFSRFNFLIVDKAPDFISINVLAIILLFVLENIRNKINEYLEEKRKFQLEDVDNETYSCEIEIDK